MKFFVKTLGCKVNLLDSARVCRVLCLAGHEAVASDNQADTVIINSCTVTATADAKSRQAAQSALRRGKRVLVMGCGPRVDLAGWSRSVVGASVVDTNEALVSLLGGMVAIDDDMGELMTIESRTRASILVQQGCDNACTFCITHRARGPHRSVPVGDVLRQVRTAHQNGVKEVVLVGINLGAWGCDTSRRYEHSRLSWLVRTLLNETDIARIRLSSLGPSYVNDELIELFADERVCDYLHLSVQSGSSGVLRNMGRTYDAEHVVRICQGVRSLRPHVSLGADMIVGFPGETDEDFDSTIRLAREVGFAKLHVFPYSRREGTEAARMAGQVAVQTKKSRSKVLRQLGQESRECFIQSQCGRLVTALVQGDGTAMTTNYLRVRTTDTGAACEGQLMQVRLRRDDVLDL